MRSPPKRIGGKGGTKDEERARGVGGGVQRKKRSGTGRKQERTAGGKRIERSLRNRGSLQGSQPHFRPCVGGRRLV